MIAPTPTDKDPRRYTLFVKADTADLTTIIRKLGGLCGRPQKERGKPEYNYSLHLRGLTPLGLQQVERVLSSINPGVGHAGSALQTPPPAGGAAPEAGAPDPIQLSVAPAEEASRLEPASELIDLTSLVPQEPSPVDASPPPSVSKPAETPALAPVSTQAVQPAQPLWGAALPLDLTSTFDSLMVGPFNRFAHAASMAVISNPGAMYNPLFLYGAPGVGKTHMMFALARSLQDQNPAEPVLFTTGPRLARAVRLAVAEGKMAEFEAFIRKTRALLIDDVHLLAVSEQNQAGLASVLRHYFSEAKAVAMASVYPPRVLGALEEALGFQLNSGWAVEMKLPSPDLQKNIITAALIRLGFEAGEEDGKEFLDRLGGEFFDLGRWLRRLKALQQILGHSGQSVGLRDLLPLLFPPPAAEHFVSGSEMRELAAELPPPPVPDPAVAKALAVFFPKERTDYARYALQQLHVFAGQYGLNIPLRQVTVQAYDPEQLYGVPFAMGELCDRVGARTALVLGPTQGSGLASREGELVHALEHILRGLEIPLAWIPFARIKESGSYMKALLDLHPAFQTA